jgi:hypothetical protein
VGGYRSKKRRFSPYQIKPKRIVRTGAKITDKTGNPPPDEAGLERAESSSTSGPYTLHIKQRGALAAPETQSRYEAIIGGKPTAGYFESNRRPGGSDAATGPWRFSSISTGKLPTTPPHHCFPIACYRFPGVLLLDLGTNPAPDSCKRLRLALVKLTFIRFQPFFVMSEEKSGTANGLWLFSQKPPILLAPCLGINGGPT